MKCTVCGNDNIKNDSACPECGNTLQGDDTSADTSQHVYSNHLLSSLKNTLKDKYEIIREIGRGGMGIVYECTDLNLDRKVAMKILPGEFSLNPEFKERFKREIKTLAQLKNPGIVNIHTAGEAGDHLYYIMDYIEGSTLAQKLEVKEKIPVKQALDIIIKICSALEHAHEKKIIHRDISPENIMISDDGDITIMDFGISRFFEETGITMTGKIMGKPPYMSPEQCLGEKLDERSDIYSLGIIFYRMVSGSLPFDGESVSVLYRQVNENIKPVRDLCPDIPDEVEYIIRSCIEKNRDNRIISAAELRKKCRNALDKTDGNTGTKKYIRAKRFITKKNLCFVITAFIIVTVFTYLLYKIFKPYSFFGNPGEYRLNEKYYSSFVISGDGSAFAYIAENDSGNYHVIFQKKEGYSIGKDYNEISDLQISDDGKHYCYSAGKDNGRTVVYDNLENKWYSSIKDLSLSSDGITLCYVGIDFITENGGSKSVIVYNNSLSDIYDNVSSLKMSRDGKHYIAAAVKGGNRLNNGSYSGGKRYIIYDGSASTPFDYTGTPTFSRDGNHYLCKTGKYGIWSASGYYTKGKWYILYDGRLSRAFDYIGTPSLSTDGMHYTADVIQNRDNQTTGSYGSGRYFLVYDNILSSPYDYITAPAISSDGKHYISSARSGNKWYILYDNRISEPYDQVNDTPLLSSDGEHYAAIVRKNRQPDNDDSSSATKYHIVYDGIAGEQFDFISDLLLTDNGKNYYAISSDGGKWHKEGGYSGGVYYLICSGIKNGSYEYIDNLLLSKDGIWYVYTTAGGGRWTDAGIYISGKYNIYKNTEVLEQDLHAVNSLWLSGNTWGYSVVRKPGNTSENVKKILDSSDENTVSDAHIDNNGESISYIDTIKDVSFLIVKKHKK